MNGHLLWTRRGTKLTMQTIQHLTRAAVDLLSQVDLARAAVDLTRTGSPRSCGGPVRQLTYTVRQLTC